MSEYAYVFAMMGKELPTDDISPRTYYEKVFMPAYYTLLYKLEQDELKNKRRDIDLKNDVKEKNQEFAHEFAHQQISSSQFNLRRRPAAVQRNKKKRRMESKDIDINLMPNVDMMDVEMY